MCAQRILTIVLTCGLPMTQAAEFALPRTANVGEIWQVAACYSNRTTNTGNWLPQNILPQDDLRTFKFSMNGTAEVRAVDKDRVPVELRVELHQLNWQDTFDEFEFKIEDVVISGKNIVLKRRGSAVTLASDTLGLGASDRLTLSQRLSDTFLELFDIVQPRYFESTDFGSAKWSISPKNDFASSFSKSCRAKFNPATLTGNVTLIGVNSLSGVKCHEILARTTGEMASNERIEDSTSVRTHSKGREVYRTLLPIEASIRYRRTKRIRTYSNAARYTGGQLNGYEIALDGRESLEVFVDRRAKKGNEQE